MYIKIVVYLDGYGLRNITNSYGHKDIPKSTIMISSKFIEYMKFRTTNQDEYDNFIQKNAVALYRFIGGKSEKSDKSMFDKEFMLIKYSVDNGKGVTEYESMLVYACHVYIMGDDGKTIDSISV